MLDQHTSIRVGEELNLERRNLEWEYLHSNFTFMRTITIDLPDHTDLDSRQTAKFLAAKLYEAGKLSLGQAAGMVGMSKVAFAEILVDYGVSLINHPIQEVTDDVKRI